MELASPLAEMNERFGIPTVAQITAGNGGLPKVRITAALATGEMYLHGAHVTSWNPRGQGDMLFVSSQSHWKADHAIRGGVPICFPWFGNKADDCGAPAHGFVRTKSWQLESIVQSADTVTVSMFTESDERTKKWWPFDFRLVHRATFGPELSQELMVTDTGASSLRFEEALHTYLRVGHIEKTRLQGLNAVHYLDKTDSNREKIQHGALVIISETDRIYLNTPHAVEVEDDALHRRLRVAKENSLTTVVWNPWAQKAKSLSDLGDGQWVQMVCVETSNVSVFAVDLAPGQQHTMKAILKASPEGQ
jgi:glucose-6-phosphate 1-epimerase